MLLDYAERTPLDAVSLERLSYLLPKNFSEEEVARLARLFRAQAAALEGRDR